jgi:hypothetical protein
MAEKIKLSESSETHQKIHAKENKHFESAEIMLE